MKTKIILVSAALAITAGIACKKSFLDVPVQGRSLPENDPNFAYNLVTGAYNSLINTNGWDRDVAGLMFVITTNILSDDADKGSTPSDFGDAGAIDNFTVTPTNGPVRSIWNGHYNGINIVNRALETLPTATAIDAATRTRLEGELKFLRGFYYFNLVRFYGDVPLILRVPTSNADANSDEFQTRTPKATVYAKIVEDLQFAADNLPLKNATQVGRATKGAAEGLLAKVYMYLGNWQKVYDLTKSVMNSMQYGLMPSYANIWREVGANGIESIFEIQTGETAACDGGIYNYSEFQGPRNGGGWSDLGWGFGGPSQNLVDAYEPNDVRKDATVISIKPVGTGGMRLWDGVYIPAKDSVENFYYNYKAYHSQVAETYCGNRGEMPKNIRILRFADVLLMNAEAALQTGRPGEALANINLLRQRAQLTPLGAVTQADIWKERRVELALEHDRFWDLVRQGRAAQVMIAHGKPFVAGKHEVLPIPQSIRDLSGGRMTQNNGY